MQPGPDEIGDHRRNLTARGLLAEHDADDRHDDDHERRQRKQRVERQRTSVLECIAIEPSLRRGLEHLQKSLGP